MKKYLFLTSLFCVFLLLAGSVCAQDTQTPASSPELSAPASSTGTSDFDEYVAFFKKVYETMDKNYYYPVTQEMFDRFVLNFKNKIYNQLKSSGKSIDFIRWRSAAFMVEAMKDPEDIFSAFMPPKAAKHYEQEALGKKIDLGIEGELTTDGFLVSKIEPRSDAYEKGLRERDLIVKIDGQEVTQLSQKDIEDRLTPLENSQVALDYLDREQRLPHIIQAISKEYFKQTVFLVPVDVPGVDCLQIQRFNRMTGEDMTRYMSLILKNGDQHLIIDLRGNPGGPPLAAREIAAFFLEPEDQFAYFKWKNRPSATLDVPRVPDKFRYHGNIVILVNDKSGSASELFTGVMQFRGRAVVMGTNTAGQVFLKSMFNFDDQSMLLLVTARGHKPDGSVFSFKGVAPDIAKPANDDALIHEAAQYLVSQTHNASGKI